MRHRRCRDRPYALVGGGGAQDQRVTGMGAYDLQADRHALAIETAGDSRGRLAGQVEGEGEGRPADVDTVPPQAAFSFTAKAVIGMVGVSSRSYFAMN